MRWTRVLAWLDTGTRGPRSLKVPNDLKSNEARNKICDVLSEEPIAGLHQQDLYTRTLARWPHSRTERLERVIVPKSIRKPRDPHLIHSMRYVSYSPRMNKLFYTFSETMRGDI